MNVNKKNQIFVAINEIIFKKSLINKFYCEGRLIEVRENFFTICTDLEDISKAKFEVRWRQLSNTVKIWRAPSPLHRPCSSLLVPSNDENIMKILNIHSHDSKKPSILNFTYSLSHSTWSWILFENPIGSKSLAYAIPPTLIENSGILSPEPSCHFPFFGHIVRTIWGLFPRSWAWNRQNK